MHVLSQSETRLAAARQRLDAALLAGEPTEPHRRAVADLTRSMSLEVESLARNTAALCASVESVQRGLAELIAAQAISEVESDLSKFDPPAESGETNTQE